MHRTDTLPLPPLVSLESVHGQRESVRVCVCEQVPLRVWGAPTMSADCARGTPIANRWCEEVVIALETGTADVLRARHVDEGGEAGGIGDGAGSAGTTGRGDDDDGVEEECTPRSRQGYKIGVGDGAHIAVVSLSNARPRGPLASGGPGVVGYMGGFVSGVVNFTPAKQGRSNGKMCRRLGIALETEERICSGGSSSTSDSKLSSASLHTAVLSRRVHHEETAHTTGHLELGFHIPLPASGAPGTAPTFATDACSLSWAMRFTFGVGGSQQEHEELTWTLPLLVLPPPD